MHSTLASNSLKDIQIRAFLSNYSHPFANAK